MDILFLTALVWFTQEIEPLQRLLYKYLPGSILSIFYSPKYLGFFLSLLITLDIRTSLIVSLASYGISTLEKSLFK